MRQFLLTFLLTISILFAVPANPEPATVQYPDGKSLTVYLRGDENLSWHESADGKILVRNQTGTFDYALQDKAGKLLPSGMHAHDLSQRTVSEKDFLLTLPEIRLQAGNLKSTKLKSSPAPAPLPFDQTDFPTLGEQNFLLILVEFSDKSFTHRPEDFDSLMNAENYTYNGAIGSVRKYYRDASFERFLPHFDIAGPVRLDSSWSFYGKGNDENIQRFVFEAVTKADPMVDFGKYDNDGDGYVDNIYFIYAGFGECFSGADVNTIWPHRWAYFASELSVDGKRVYDYSTSMEFYGTSGTTRTTIGVIAHEFGHVCGLPDYYDTDYEGSGGDCGGLGGWDLMAGGSWNYSGNRPPLFNAGSRVYLRWVEPQPLDSAEFVTLNPAHTHNEVRYFFTPTAGEFFMMENRQRSGWDAAIPGHGLLVFHIDMNHSGWNNNTLNCNPYRQGFDLEEADGLGNISAYYINAGDPFPGASDNRFFTDESTPNALSWTGEASRKPIRNISEDTGIISFYFGDVHVDKAEHFYGKAEGTDRIKLGWKLNPAADSVIVVISTENTINYPKNRSTYLPGDSAAGGMVIYKGVDTVFYHEGLQSGTRYYYGIFSFEDSAYTYSEKSVVSVLTDSPKIYAESFGDSPLPQGWKIKDQRGNGTWTKENPLGRSLESSTPEDGFMIIDSEYHGDVMLDAELITRSFNFALSRSVILRFAHRLEVNSITLARVLYTVNDGLTWYEAKRWTSATEGTEFCELDLSKPVAGFRDVKFKFNFRGSGEKYWCVDDIGIASALDNGLSASFHLAERSGSKPFTVKLMNTSVVEPGEIDTAVWDFGDGSDFVSGYEPEHTFTRSGHYPVTLMVRSGELQSNYSRENYVYVSNEAPEYIGESDTLNVRKNAENTVNLKTLFRDPNGDPLTFSWLDNSTQLSITAENDSIVRIAPAADYLGLESVRFTAVDNEDDSTLHSVDIWISETASDENVPAVFSLEQNYPNPFNPETSIRYQLPRDEFVRLEIFNMTGRRIATLADAQQDAGYYTLRFDAGNIPAGIYFYRLQAGTFTQTKKMLVIK